jgi:hypothetical protein
VGGTAVGAFPNPASLFYLSAGDCCPHGAIYNTDTSFVWYQGSGSGGDETLDKAMTADGAPGVLLGGVNHHDPAVNLRLLESSHKNLPRAGDGVWSRRRVDGGGRVGGAGTVSTPADRSPNSYPTALPPVLQNPALFERLDADALFWTFYYQQGTARQCTYFISQIPPPCLPIQGLTLFFYNHRLGGAGAETGELAVPQETRHVVREAGRAEELHGGV